MKYKISHQIPMIYYRIKRIFPHILWDRGVVIAYGDTIYAKDPLPDHLLEHEKIHLQQQAGYGGPEAWWDRYLADPQFRLQQEIEAHKVEIAHIHANQNLTKKYKKEILKFIAQNLSGPTYGNIISYQEAINLTKL